MVLALTTHDADGISTRDTALARKIDDVIAAIGFKA